MTKFTLDDCVRLAEFAHFHQRDKSGGEYITHPKRVLASVQAQGAMPYVQMAAVLHDVTEDTDFTPEMLLDLGVPEAAVDLVALLDRGYSRQKWEALVETNEGTPYTIDDFYYHEIRNNPGALQVKLADIGDNLQPWRLSYLSDATQARLRAKYAKAIDRLS